MVHVMKNGRLNHTRAGGSNLALSRASNHLCMGVDHVRLRWLDIGQVRFFALSRSINTQKRTNVQPS